MGILTLDNPIVKPNITGIDVQNITIKGDGDMNIIEVVVIAVCDGQTVVFDAKQAELNGLTLAQIKTLMQNKIKAYVP